MFFSSFKNKKILITGHTGFKGSWLAIWLMNLGANVTGYALAPKTKFDNYSITNLSGKIKNYISDIRDKEKFLSVVENEKPEIIFHLAAQPLVIESYLQPHYTIETNVIGTTNVLEAFRLSESARLLIVITTDKVYENYELSRGYNEKDRLGGKDTYSASKAAAEIIVNAYHESFFTHKDDKTSVTVRAGNVIGGGDWADNRIIPDCIRAIENNEQILIRNPKATRPWQHVLEPLSGYLLLAEKILTGEKHLQGAWNFGPNSESIIPVEDLVSLLLKHYGAGSYKLAPSSSTYMRETNYLSLDITKAIQHLKWHPSLNINQAVKLTTEWYKRYNTENMYDFCCHQIKEYEQEWNSKN